MNYQTATVKRPETLRSLSQSVVKRAKWEEEDSSSQSGYGGSMSLWGGAGSLSLHVSGALCLCRGGAEVLPAERGQQHGGGQVHG